MSNTIPPLSESQAAAGENDSLAGVRTLLLQEPNFLLVKNVPGQSVTYEYQGTTATVFPIAGSMARFLVTLTSPNHNPPIGPFYASSDGEVRDIIKNGGRVAVVTEATKAAVGSLGS